MELKNFTTDEILGRIYKLQDVQRTNPPSSAAWLMASDALQPLFAEMARRQGKEAA